MKVEGRNSNLLEQKKIYAVEFCDQKWVSNLAFLVNVTTYLHKLNVQLQGKHQLIHDIWSYLQAITTEQTYE